MVKGLFIENGNFILNSNVAPKFSNVPKWLLDQNPQLTPEDLTVQPVKDIKTPVTQKHFLMAEDLIKLFMQSVLPSVPPEEWHRTIRAKNDSFILLFQKTQATVIFSRWNGDTEQPVFKRGSWTLNPLRALTLGGKILESIRQRDSFSYKISNNAFILKNKDIFSFLNPETGAAFTINNYEKELLKRAMESYCLTGGIFGSLGNKLGRIQVLPDNTFRIGSVILKDIPIYKAFVLKELLD